MKYLEITIHTNDAGIEVLTAYLMRMGVNSTWIESGQVLEEILQKKNPFDWDYVDEQLLEEKPVECRLKFYLDDNADGKALFSRIKVDLMKLKSDELYGDLPGGMEMGRLYAESKPVDDSLWKENWKEHFSRVQLTGTLEVRSLYAEEAAPEKGMKVILLDPGMAFGTGTHETTSLCARLMEQEGCEGKMILDIGCGTGILSIAAAKLGGSQVLGVDIDPEAVATARENIRLNHCSETVEIMQGNLTDGLEVKADLVVANLVAELVADLAGTVWDVLAPGGLLILSGILTEKESLVAGALVQAGFQIEEILKEGEWCAISAR